MDVPVVKYVIITFEGNINPGDLKGIKMYLQETKDIDKEADKLDISVSNAKDIIDHFLSIAKKYDSGRLAFMVQTGAVPNAILGRYSRFRLKMYTIKHMDTLYCQALEML